MQAVVLTVDGVYSQSRPSLLWSAYRNSFGRGATVGFSYTGHGLHYGPDTTIQTLEASADAFLEYLNRLPAGCQIIPVAFSLGSAVTVLALDRWLRDHPERVERIPLIVLIAPALAPEPRLLLEYHRRRREGSGTTVPAPIRQLGSRDGAFYRGFEVAIANVCRSLKVFAVYSVHDDLTPILPQHLLLRMERHQLAIDRTDPPDKSVGFHTSLLETSKGFVVERVKAELGIA